MTSLVKYQWTASRRLMALGMIVAGLGLVTFFVKQRMAISGVTTADLRVWLAHKIAGDALTDPVDSAPDRLADLANDFDMSNLTIQPKAIMAGGPPKDGIPSLTEPATTHVGKARFMRDNDRVVGVVINGHARAYPINVLNYHEAINDQLGGQAIAVIYCPLCDSVSVVDRTLAGKTYTFGISGLLTNSNVLLYDRTDNALWSQVKLQAVSGPNAGQSLRHLTGWQLTTMDHWKQQYPDSTVVTYNTGYQRQYANNPYGGYFRNDGLMFPVSPIDRRFANKTPMVGVRYAGVTRAYMIDDVVKGSGEVTDDIDGATIRITAGADGKTVHIVQVPPGAEVVYTFWFAWAAFHPDTEVFGHPAAATTQPSRATDSAICVPPDA